MSPASPIATGISHVDNSNNSNRRDFFPVATFLFGVHRAATNTFVNVIDGRHRGKPDGACVEEDQDGNEDKCV